MSYCGNCGTNVPDNADFCPNCGQKIDVTASAKNENTAANPTEGQSNPYQSSQTTNPYQQSTNQGATSQGFQTQGQPQQGNVPSGPSFFDRLKNDKKMLYICIGVVVAIIAVIAIVIGVSNSKKTVDLSDYYTVTFDGADSAGTATVECEETALYNALTDAGGSKILSATASSYYEPQYDIIDSIEVKVSPNEDLSNGDEVTVTYTYSEATAKQYGIKLKGKKETVKVSGLKEVEEVNPFDYVTIEYTGVSPDIYAEVEVDSSKISMLDDVYFDMSKYYDLAIGDEITVSIDDYYAELALEKGYLFTETEHTYTVESADSYLTSFDDLSEEALSELQSEASDEITAEHASISSYSISECNYIGAYLLMAKDSYYYDGSSVVLVYQTTATDSDGDFTDYPVYLAVEFGDVVVKADDSISYDSPSLVYNYFYPNDGWTSVYGYETGEELYNDIITSNVNNYTYAVDGDALKAFGE